MSPQPVKGLSFHQTASPAGDQMFKHTSLLGAFHIQVMQADQADMVTIWLFTESLTHSSCQC